MHTNGRNELTEWQIYTDFCAHEKLFTHTAVTFSVRYARSSDCIWRSRSYALFISYIFSHTAQRRSSLYSISLQCCYIFHVCVFFLRFFSFLYLLFEPLRFDNSLVTNRIAYYWCFVFAYLFEFYMRLRVHTDTHIVYMHTAIYAICRMAATRALPKKLAVTVTTGLLMFGLVYVNVV